MALLSRGSVTRWAAGDGGLTAPSGTSIDEAAAMAAMPEIGLHDVEVGGEAFQVERVGSRYCSAADMRAYAEANNDSFADAQAYPDDALLAAIQAAEETLEACCGRSFCERARDVMLEGTGRPEDLPEVDVRSISGGTQLYDRMAIAGEPMTVRMVYGKSANERIRQACMRLAATYLRPRAGAENARGTSVEGVYISYELATGEAPNWTGIPYVDSTIANYRSGRTMIL